MAAWAVPGILYFSNLHNGNCRVLLFFIFLAQNKQKKQKRKEAQRGNMTIHGYRTNIGEEGKEKMASNLMRCMFSSLGRQTTSLGSCQPWGRSSEQEDGPRNWNFCLPPTSWWIVHSVMFETHRWSITIFCYSKCVLKISPDTGQKSTMSGPPVLLEHNLHFNKTHN